MVDDRSCEVSATATVELPIAVTLSLAHKLQALVVCDSAANFADPEVQRVSTALDCRRLKILPPSLPADAP